MDTTIVTILVLIFAVISICVPFYILKIRNQVVQINKIMTTMARQAFEDDGRGDKECEMMREAIKDTVFLLILMAMFWAMLWMT